MNIATLDEVIKNIAGMNCDEFSNFFDELKEVNEAIEDVHHEDIIEFMTDRLNIVSEDELVELTDYEKENLVQFIVNLY